MQPTISTNRSTSFLYSIISTFKRHDSTSAALCGTNPKQKTLAPIKMENGMILDLRGQGGRTRQVLFTRQITTLALMALLTTTSCSGPPPDMPQWLAGIIEPEPLADRVTEAPKRRLSQRDEAHPKVRREQPRTSVSPKGATVHAPNATSRSASRPALKKANTSPRL